MIKRLIPFIFLLVLSSSQQALTARNNPLLVGIKTYDGILLVWNEKGNYFTVEFKGESLKGKQAKEGGLHIAVDDKLVQIQSALIKNYLPAGPGTLTDNTILLKHMQWESGYIQKFFKEQKIKVKIQGLQNIRGRSYYSWEYKFPASFYKDRATPLNQRVRKQLFLTTRNRDHIIILNGTVAAGNDEYEVRQYMIDTMRTLETSAKPYDIKALQARYKKKR